MAALRNVDDDSGGGGVIGVGGLLRREPCKKCNLPVFLAERLNVDNHLYHRTCFRCARCSNQLSLANYYETEDGQYCCETCPDEEKTIMDRSEEQTNERQTIVLTRSLSDDEKEQNLHSLEEQRPAIIDQKLIQARNDFIIGQLKLDGFDECDGTESTTDDPPDLPKTQPPDKFITSAHIQIVANEEDELVEDASNLNVDPSELSVTSLDTIETKTLDSENDVIGDSNTVNINTDNVNFKCSSDNVNQPLATNDTKLEVLDRNNTEFVTKEEANTVTKTSPQIVENIDQLDESSADDSVSMVTRDESHVLDDSEQVESLELAPCTVPQTIGDGDKQNTNEDTEEIVTVRSYINSSSEEQIVDSINDNISCQIEDKGTENEKHNKSTNIQEYPEELNPFGDEDNDEIKIDQSPVKKESTNPFGSTDEEDDIEPVPLVTATSTPKKVLKAPKINLNPFESDENTSDDDSHAMKKPIPKPRSLLKTPEPSPRLQKHSNTSQNSGFCGSTTSLESSVSSKSSQTPTGTYRKKKPAPPPPNAKDLFSSPDSTTQSPIKISTPMKAARKSRPAPPPPIQTTTTNPLSEPNSLTSVTIEAQNNVLIAQMSPTKSTNTSTELEAEKNNKDEKNRNRQSLLLTSKSIKSSNSNIDIENTSLNISPPNKSTYGKWKRKKGPAPPRPVPQRRQINSLSTEELRRQLDVIEIQQQGLEKQGVKLEQLIREKCEAPGSENDSSSINPEVEDLVLQLFELVNEKNELFRKQAELMYLRRQQRLEEEHAELEYQIRCLMERPESNKTDFDKAREEELLKRLIEVVEIRNEIVECLEMDRIREAEEDESISTHLNLFSAKRDELAHVSSASSSIDSLKLSKKEKKKQKKIRKSKGVTIDADKDVDETEIVMKDKKKKKWLFK